MKSKLSKKGFTMVELLAAIVILGILSTIGLTAISKILEKSKANYYKTTENTLLEAGQSYVLNNRSLLPKEIGEVKTFTLDELYKAKALTEKITDENSKSCDGQKSKFYVYKKTSSEYSYDAVLYCPSCEEKNNCKELTAKNAPTITISTTGCTDNNLGNISSANATLEITAPSNSKIESYSYNVYKENKSVYYSGIIRVKDLNKVNATINLSKYLPGTIKIVVKSTTKDGATSSEEKSLTCEDTQDVSCNETINYENNTLFKSLTAKAGETKCEDDEWLNSTNTEGRKLWVECVSGTGTNCKEPTYSGTYTKDSTYKTIKMEDTAGNHGNCIVKTCIDKTYPKITVQIYKANSKGKATGNAIKEFEVDAKKDKTKSTVTNQVTGWINKSAAPDGVVIRISASDTTSKIKTLVYKEKTDGKTETEEKKLNFGDEKTLKTDTNDILLKTDGYKQYEVIAKDHAGNTSTLDFDVMLDTTLPTVPTVSMYVHNKSKGVSSSTNLSAYSNDTWTSKYVFTKASASTDEISGFKKYQYTTTGKVGKNSNEDGEQLNILEEGISTIKYRACDTAGNCSGYSAEKTIKEDRTKPTTKIKLKSENDNYKTTKAKLSVSGTDNISSNDGLSGIKKYCYKSSDDKDYTCTSTAISGKEVTISDDYNGNDKTYYAYTIDEAGNTSEIVSKKYTVYKYCTDKEIYDYGSWGGCDTACGDGHKSRTAYRRDIHFTSHTCSSTTDSTTCTGTNCKKICDYTGTELFGSYKGSTSGNYGDYHELTFECENGGTCTVYGGYDRICVTDDCGNYKGKTAKEIDNSAGCDFSRYWCSCSTQGRF